MPAALDVVGQRRVKIPPNELNRLLREALDEHPPPSFKGKRLKVGFATQAGTEAPTIVLFVNDVGLLHFSYRRYLEKKIRDRFGLMGNPIRIVLRSDAGKRHGGKRGAEKPSRSAPTPALETASLAKRTKAPRRAEAKR
jgi:GTP-binding protein